MRLLRGRTIVAVEKLVAEEKVRAERLVDAQDKAAQLFEEIERRDMIRAGVGEQELSDEIRVVAEAADGARQIAAAAEQARNASRQAAAASTEQAQGADDLAAAIEEIASLADALKPRA